MICFIWVLWRVASFCCEGKFGYTIIEFFTGLPRLDWWISRGCGNFFGNRCSYIMTQIFSHFFSPIFWHSSSWFLLWILWNKFTIMVFIWIRLILLILNSLSICNMFLINTIFGFSKFMSWLSWNSTGRRLPSATISLWPTVTYRVCFISFLGSQRSQMRFLLSLFLIQFQMIGVVQLVLTWCGSLIMLNSIKLFVTFLHVVIF